VAEQGTTRKGDPTTRQALLDAAAAIMVEDGYAAATTRSVATRAGVNNALVYYYFGTMDELFLALFRNGAERSFERLEAALTTDQPLWGLWDLIHDFSGSALTMELIALANHRKVIRAEISAYSKRFRTRQLELLTGVLEGYGVDPGEWPVVSVVLLMAGISRYLLIEEAFDVQIGHRETVTLIERHITALEGRRRRTRTSAKPKATVA
jgi:AcrR family transcriptional regulator